MAIGTSNPALKTVSLFIQPAESVLAVRECGRDSEYEPVSCRLKPNLLEVVERSGRDARMPSYMGRYFSSERGSVLVQVWGPKSAEQVQLIRELLKDPLLGVQTSAALNDEGEELDDFEALQTRATLSEVIPDPS